jgi:hypothetical protein
MFIIIGEQLVTSMYRIAGVREGSDMTVDDFKKIFASKEYAHTLEKATLNLDGKYLFRLHTIYYHYFVVLIHTLSVV